MTSSYFIAPAGSGGTGNMPATPTSKSPMVGVADLAKASDLSLADACRRYLNSFPGPSESANNISAFVGATDYLNGTPLGNMRRRDLKKIMDYRLSIMDLATTWKDIALRQGQAFNDCRLWDHETWLEENQFARARIATFHRYFSVIFNVKLPSRPAPGQGRSYSKPYYYLAAAFVENALNDDAVNTAIATIQAYNESSIEGRI